MEKIVAKSGNRGFPIHIKSVLFAFLLIIIPRILTGQNNDYPNLKYFLLEIRPLSDYSFRQNLWGQKEVSVLRFRENEVFQNYGLFCKWEAIFQKQQKVPLYFRLGSKEYVDYLDGHNLSYLLREH